MIANISALTLAGINLATTLCKFPKLAIFTLIMGSAASVACKSSMSPLVIVACSLAILPILAILVTWPVVAATAKSYSLAAKIVKIGLLVKVMSTIVTHAAALEV